MSQPPREQHAEQRVERVLEEGLERVATPRAAHAVVARVERLSAGTTEEERGRAAAEDTAGAADQASAAATTIERAAARPAPPEHAIAEVLDEVAAQSVAPTQAAQPVVQAARATLRPGRPAARRGRRLLRDAVLRRMGPLNAVDARIYLAINEAPHPARLDRLAETLTVVTTGGWIWLIGALLVHLVGVPRSRTAVRRLVPSLVVTTWLIEYPIKAFFRRRRPFASIVRALVIGKKPGSWSFPSGHTGSSFASAWILSACWPRTAPVLFGLAGTVGFSRIYTGAHYPGDVVSGAVFGMLLSEMVRRAITLSGRLLPAGRG